MSDRRGRLRTGSVDGTRRPSPGYRVRNRARFEALVRDVVRTLPRSLVDAAGPFRVVVQHAPPSADRPALAAFVPGPQARLIVFRGPVEARAATRDDLAFLLRDVAITEIALGLGRDPLEFGAE